MAHWRQPRDRASRTEKLQSLKQLVSSGAWTAATATLVRADRDRGGPATAAGHLVRVCSTLVARSQLHRQLTLLCMPLVCLSVCLVAVLQVAVLFKNHNDLLTQFTYFLPDNSPPQVMRQLQQLGVSAAAPAVTGLLEQLQQLGLSAAAATAATATAAEGLCSGWDQSAGDTGLSSLGGGWVQVS